MCAGLAGQSGRNSTYVRSSAEIFDGASARLKRSVRWSRRTRIYLLAVKWLDALKPESNMREHVTKWLDALKPESNMREHVTFVETMSGLIDAAFYHGIDKRDSTRFYRQAVGVQAKKVVARRQAARGSLQS